MYVETDATAKAVRAVLKHLEALGAARLRLRIESPAQFMSGADRVYSTDLRLLGVRRGPDFLMVSVDGDADSVRPLSPRVRIVWGP